MCTSPSVPASVTQHCLSQSDKVMYVSTSTYDAFAYAMTVSQLVARYGTSSSDCTASALHSEDLDVLWYACGRWSILSAGAIHPHLHICLHTTLSIMSTYMVAYVGSHSRFWASQR